MKTCTKCNEIKSDTEFHRNKRTVDGIADYCKPCKSTYGKRNKYERTTGDKKCNVCLEIKSADEYHSQSCSTDGLQGKCKACSFLAQKKSKENAGVYGFLKDRLRNAKGNVRKKREGRGIQLVKIKHNYLIEIYKKYINNKKNKIKLIHVSTDEVYGDIKKNKFSKEKDPYLPSSPYAASKAASDLLIQSYIRTYNLPCIITNCCNNYGPKQFPEKLIPKIIINLLDNKKIPIYGNGKQEREWIHVEDHCSALYKIFQIGQVGEQINIGSGEVRNNLKLTKVLINNFNEIHHIFNFKGSDVTYKTSANKRK